MEAFEQGVITEEIALLYCTKRSVMSRAIDNIKKGRGEMTMTGSSLRMKTSSSEGGAAPPVLKIK